MSATDEIRGLIKLPFLRVLALSGLIGGIAALSLSVKATITDPDLWWHLSVGDWIVRNHSFPHVGILSRTAAERPWIAYSWGFEVLLSRAYAWFGLVGIASFGLILTLAVALALFWMLQRLSRNFWLAWFLSGVGCFAFLFSLMPRPVFFSMMFFMVMLTLLLEAQRDSRVQPLYWLPLLFMLWANFHIQFVYGLAVLALFAGVHLGREVAASRGLWPEWAEASHLPVKPLIGVAAASALACCIGPYTWHLFQVVLEYGKSKAAYDLIQELQPMDFRTYDQYVLLLLIGTTFFVLGSRKKVDIFRVALLVFAALSAFRTSRDAWFAGVCALACLVELYSPEETRAPLKRLEFAGAVALSGVLVVLIAANMGVKTRELDKAISQHYPVKASNFIRRNELQGPLYNTLEWGGFLTWYMPQYPVAIDGRNDLYGDATDLMTFQSALGEYTTDPYLKEARVVLLPKTAPLATLLTIDPAFRVVYEDRQAVVLIRN